jgi:hypothetical protein
MVPYGVVQYDMVWMGGMVGYGWQFIVWCGMTIL